MFLSMTLLIHRVKYAGIFGRSGTKEKLKEKYNTVSATKDEMVCPLFFVPTAYALNYGGSYSLNSLKSVDSDVVIAFTGYDCFSNIRGSSCADMAGRVGRNP